MSSSATKKNPSTLPSPAELGITPDVYAYCYCEENVRRAIIQIISKLSTFNSDVRKIEPFAIFCSSYQQPEPRIVFPGSWLRSSLVTLVVDSRTRQSITWDYHVFIGIKVTLTTQQKQPQTNSNNNSDNIDETINKTTEVQYFIADYDSNTCNLGKKGTVQKFMPLDDYCAVTFSKIDKKTARVRVVTGMDYWDKFRSTRAHMLPPFLLKNWLREKENRNRPAPADQLMEPPLKGDAATCGGDGGVDLAHFVNMSTNEGCPAPGKVLTVDEFRQGKW